MKKIGPQPLQKMGWSRQLIEGEIANFWAFAAVLLKVGQSFMLYSKNDM